MGTAGVLQCRQGPSRSLARDLRAQEEGTDRGEDMMQRMFNRALGAARRSIRANRRRDEVIQEQERDEEWDREGRPTRLGFDGSHLATATAVVWEVARGALGKVVVRFDSRNMTVVKFADGARLHVSPARGDRAHRSPLPAADLRPPLRLDVGSEVAILPAASDHDLPTGSEGTVTRFDSRGNVV
eukprot:gene42399-29759_t